MHNNLKGNHPFSYQGPHFTAYYFLSFSGSKVHLFPEQVSTVCSQFIIFSKETLKDTFTPGDFETLKL